MATHPQRFTLSIRTSGSPLSEIANQIRGLIHDPEATIETKGELSMLILCCRCKSAEEVKGRIAPCKDVERVVEDFASPAPTLVEAPEANPEPMIILSDEELHLEELLADGEPRDAEDPAVPKGDTVNPDEWTGSSGDRDDSLELS